MLEGFLILMLALGYADSTGSLNRRPVRPGKDVNQPRAENDDTLEIGDVGSPRRSEVIIFMNIIGNIAV